MNPGPARILHVISGMGTGGAETALLRLATHLDPARFHCTVLALRDGPMRARFGAAGVQVSVADLASVSRVPAALRRIAAVSRETRPRLVHGWMNHGNLAAWRAWRVAGAGARLVWGIRQTLYDLAYEKPATRWVIRAEAALSRAPDVILFNSTVAVGQHRAQGFENPRCEVIPNGFDTTQFRPDAQRRAATRRELGISADAELIGCIGRNHEMKGLPIFITALAEVMARRPNAYALALGHQVPLLSSWLQANVHPSIAARILLRDEVTDPEGIYPALDLLCSTSLHGEGFPNVVAEAMACEVPCVVTDVGDAAAVVADTGRVVPRGDARACAAAVIEILEAGGTARDGLGKLARRRVIENYSIDTFVARHARLYESLMRDDEIH